MQYCLQCSNPFEPDADQGYDGQFCSLQCHTLFWDEHSGQKGTVVRPTFKGWNPDGTFKGEGDDGDDNGPAAA